MYYLDYSGKIVYTRKFDSLKNNDWEDLTADESFIYIADMGNNFDTRKNLMITKVSKDKNDKNFEIINFYYPEQSDFNFKLKSQFDAEAIISFDEFLLIFTKNRAKKITDIYKVPKKAGSYKAKKIGTLNTNSIVTGGDYKKDLNLLVLTSTIEFDNYLLLKIDNFDLKSEKNHINMYEIPIGKTQVEAVKIMRSLGCRNWKIGSGEVFSNWIIKEILKKKRDGLIISSGMSTWKDLIKNYKYLDNYDNKIRAHNIVDTLINFRKLKKNAKKLKDNFSPYYIIHPILRYLIAKK